jgi:hypothetical protein
MPARQLWVYLTDRDVDQLIAQISAREPGLVVSRGRYFRGELQGLLENPERRESLPQERRIYLLHRKHSTDLIANLQPEGPFAGWSQIDEERTDCLVIRLKGSRPGELEPASIYAHVTYWRAADKDRKRPMFSIWAGQTFKWLAARLERTSVEILRAGPDALAKAKAGEVKLTYLNRTIAAVKDRA